jgi:Asp-tRNA(Asn)/Glu-tRNA(Gln) amidotransferase A subunit family amidase
MTDAYNLRTLSLPRLSGAPLRLFAAALDRAWTRRLLTGRLLTQGGIAALRENRFPEPPTFYPMHLPEATSACALPPADARAVERAVLERFNNEPFPNLVDYARAYREGRATPLSVAEAALEAMAQSDAGSRPLRAFRMSLRDDVLAQAAASTERFRAGRPLGLLDGVPMAIKDEVDMAPYDTTVGTCFLGGAPAREDSTVVARLREAGALLLGKANMHELGINPDGFNEHFGTVRNPYNLDCHAGGSSSGSAAAVAAGLCPVSIGADGGGSIRIPAALCGLVGLKATFGRVSEAGAAPLTWTMGHLGPIGATVADVAQVYACIAGPDTRDGLSQHQPPVCMEGWDRRELSGLTLGVYRPWFEHAEPEIVEACDHLLRHLADAGATVREIVIPELDEMRIAQAVTILSEMAAAMDRHGDACLQLSASTRINLTLGRAAAATDYATAQRVRTRGLDTFRRLFAEVDAIITPATAVVAPRIPDDGLPAGWSDLGTVTELMRFAFPANLLGLPAISFPAGYTHEGLPIGMQALGRPWEEHVLLRIASTAEQFVERRRPPYFFDPTLAWSGKKTVTVHADLLD